jgi:tetratricopeptide (TPR) repeat protein
MSDRTPPSAATPPVDDVPGLFGVRIPAWAGLLVIAALTIAAYWQALGGETLWDDTSHIPQGEMRTLDGLSRIWFDLGSTQQYYPVLFSWFWVQQRLWGEHMLGYHLVNLLLHIGAACLVYAVLQKLRIPSGLLAASIFALHPVHVESVAWISEQKNTLSAVFYLGAMLAYLHFDESRSPSTYALALVLFVIALLSKTVTVTLPPVLLVIFWWRRGVLSWKRDVLPLLPFFAFATADGLLTMWVERKLIGAEGHDFDLAPLQRPLLAGRALWFYLEKLVLPVNLIFIYPRWQLDPASVGQWLVVAAAVTVLVGLWALRHWSRAPLAAALFFVGTLFPVLGFLNVYFFRYSFVSDHFPYIASLGVIVLASAAIITALKRISPETRRLGGVACLTLVGVLAALSWRQSRVYADVETLFQTTIDRNPDCSMAYNNLGALRLHQQGPEPAIPYFERSLSVNPDNEEAHSNLGVALGLLGRYPEAIAHFEAALRKRPDFAEVHSNLAEILTAAKRPQESLVHFDEALRLQPDDFKTRNSFGVALLQLSRPSDALAQFEAAVRIKPDYSKAWANIAGAKAQLQQPAEAIAAAEKALDLARQQGEVTLVEQIEPWLISYRAGQSEQATTLPAAALPPP